MVFLSSLINFDVNIFKDEQFAAKVEDHVGLLPDSVADVVLLQQNTAAFILVTENSPAKGNVALQGAVNTSQV